jgi:nitrogen fixation protein NifU and related proteins
MSDLAQLYQSVILDHNRNPRNFRVLDNADGQAEGFNPLCGDRVKVWVKVEGDRVADVSFEGTGCALSKASASLMTTAIKGKSRAEVAEFPSRVKCASLAWHALQSALKASHQE